MIKPVFSYVNVVWQMLCSKDCLVRILRLQQRAARTILDAESRNPLLIYLIVCIGYLFAMKRGLHNVQYCLKDSTCSSRSFDGIS